MIRDAAFAGVSLRKPLAQLRPAATRQLVCGCPASLEAFAVRRSLIPSLTFSVPFAKFPVSLQKFPVPLRGEFCYKRLNLLVD
jgi:hypothetical protein